MALPIIAALGGVALRFLSVGVLQFIALKAFIWTVGVTILPIIIYNVISKILQEMMNYASAHITSQVGTQGLLLQFTGMAAWIFDEMNLTVSITLIFSAISLRFMLNLIGK